MHSRTTPTKANHVKNTSCAWCGSADNLSVYDDGSGFCHTPQCGYKSPTKMGNIDMEATPTKPKASLPKLDLPTTNIPDRKISRAVSEFYGVLMEANEATLTAHYYPYSKAGEVVAYKKRTLPKTFSVLGDFTGVDLFGQHLFPSGGKRVVITEGELDAMSVAEAIYDKYGKFYPVVSMPSASGKTALLNSRDWLRSFDEIVLFMDNDKAGEGALKEAANILGIEKIKIARGSEKDASDILVKHGKQSVLVAVWDAQPYCPAGIVTGEAIWEEIQDHQNKESVPYPECLSGLNDKLKGMRLGEITLFTSGTGSGKSTVIKEIILDLYERTEAKIGIISLEEGIADTAINLIAMHSRVSRHAGDGLDDLALRAGYDALFADGRLVLLDHQGAVSDDSLLDKIRYMAAMGCKYMILDHITIAVSEGADGLSGNEAMDKTMSDLLKITKQFDVWLGVISHLRKDTERWYCIRGRQARLT